VPDAPKSKTGSKHSIRQVETVGLVLLALLSLTFIVVRYWEHIPWGAR
jgi:hypothetical protein